jgi:hypothetical protein
MADKLDLTTHEIPDAIDTAILRGHKIVLGHIDENGDPIVSFRGSTHVHGPEQLAIWVRKRDSGFATAIKTHPHVHVIYHGGHDGPGPGFLSFKGSARTDPSANDTVYEASVEPERDHDPERNGIAVIIDVDSVEGFSRATGKFEMKRAAS